MKPVVLIFPAQSSSRFDLGGSRHSIKGQSADPRSRTRSRYNPTAPQLRLIPGTRVGPYEITAPLGVGGMGEVYRATDTNLKRQVAVKVLPPVLAGDVERLARFQREAEILATLNHPNIAHVYGLERPERGDAQEHVVALVMELVEGPTLADLIAKGAMSIDEALPIVKQLTDALEAAHERGIVHRDLKPANIKVRTDGTAKVLDFGLAKAVEPTAALSSVLETSTRRHDLARTHEGMILGTAAYMSPEQAAGKPIDKRTDLWSLGVVLFEMLIGRQVFNGETVSDVLASVLRDEPDWTALPADTPPSVRRLLRRCLQKDARRRLDSARAARLEIDDALARTDTGTSSAPPPRPRRVAPLVVGAALGGALVALAAWPFGRPASQNARLPSRFAITPPVGQPPWVGPFDRSIAISPDGRHLVYGMSPGAGPGSRLMVRALDQLDVRPLTGINGARAPFFSADSQWVGFFQNTELSKVPIGGGPAISICKFSGAPRGASWGADGIVVFATSDPITGLWRVPAGGGEATVLTTPAQGEGDHLFPTILPDGRGVLFTIAGEGQSGPSIAVLDAKTNQQRILIRGGSQAEYVDTGQLVYAAAGTLRAVRFDLSKLQVLSDPVPVLDHVRMASTGAANYVVSRSGTLAYLPGGPDVDPLRSLMWVDRTGHEESIKAPLRAYMSPRLSPDGTRVALSIADQENDIWILDLARESALRKLTSGPSPDTNPVWSADGKQIIFTSSRSGPQRLYLQAADGSGTAEVLPTGANPPYATSVTPNGSGIVGHRDGSTSFDVVLFPFPDRAVPTNAAQVQELVKTPAIEFNAQISPDGRYLAYQSNESGRFEVVVRPFPLVNSGMWTISSGGGTRPVWARSGKELFYRDDAAAVMAVTVDTTRATFDWSPPVKLFDANDASSEPSTNYDVTPDGRRFLMLKDSASRKPEDIVVVLDWFEELKRLLPAQ